jgi:hypothetical protein
MKDFRHRFPLPHLRAGKNSVCTTHGVLRKSEKTVVDEGKPVQLRTDFHDRDRKIAR